MKQVSPALSTLINSQAFHDFDLYTITLFGGGVLRYTTADFDISFNGATWLSSSVRVDQKSSKTQAHWKTGLDVDTWVVVFMPRPVDLITGASFPDKIGNVPWIQAASSGALDAADVQVDRAYFATVPTWPIPASGAVPVGTITIFAGVIAEVDTTDTMVVVTVNDYRDLLSLQMPRHAYQSQCRHTLFDTGCAILASSFAVNGVAGAGSTQAKIVAASLAIPGGSKTYKLGRLVITSGLNNTFQRTIGDWDGTNLSLLNPLPFAITAGDAFTAYPGCDKSFAACGLFANTVNFGGFPFIPDPETAA